MKSKFIFVGCSSVLRHDGIIYSRRYIYFFCEKRLTFRILASAIDGYIFGRRRLQFYFRFVVISRETIKLYFIQAKTFGVWRSRRISTPPSPRHELDFIFRQTTGISET